AAEEMPRLLPDGWEEYHRAAWFLAGCSPLAEKDEALTGERRRALAREYANRAVELLRQAVRRGFADLADPRESPGFDALRGRDDFKRLLQESPGKSGG